MPLAKPFYELLLNRRLPDQVFPRSDALTLGQASEFAPETAEALTALLSLLAAIAITTAAFFIGARRQTFE